MCDLQNRISLRGTRSGKNECFSSKTRIQKMAQQGHFSGQKLKSYIVRRENMALLSHSLPFIKTR
jgi:hypothetical protein